MYKTKSYNKIFAYLASISLILFLIVFSTYIICFINKNALYNLVMKYKTYEYLPFKLSDIDLKLITTELMKYLAGGLNFLETKVHINGVLTDFYSIRTKIHMGDVRQIFKVFTICGFVSIVIFIVSMFYFIRNFKNDLSILKNAWFKTLLFFFIILIPIIIFASINFNAFFIKFHELLFTNDFWLLNPNEDFIICLLPEKIFIIYGIKIVLLLFAFIVLVSLYFGLLSKIQPRQEAK